MVKGISFLRPVAGAAFERLSGFFAALGFAPGKGWEKEDSRGASFLAPLGNLELVLGQMPSTADIFIEVTSLDALGISAGILLKSLKTEPPAQRQKGVMVKDVPELVDALKKKGLI